MMRILYGVQGTGNGHITRARHLAEELAKRSDIEVDYIFSGRPAAQYFDMEAFGTYQMKRGLSFVTAKGKISYSKTLTSNNLCQFVNDFKSMDLGRYDLLLNDFEPVSAWAAKRVGLPSLSLSHQAAFLKKVPKHQQTIIDKLITRYFAPTEISLGTHWYHFGQDIIPPFVSSDLRNSSVSSNDKILVYLPFEELLDVIEQLQIISDVQFICFHPRIEQSETLRNVTLKPLSIKEFKATLLSCGGVISNCGFELSTECLALGKPLLTKPLHGQFEQASNAHTLHSLNACSVMNTLSSDTIDNWLSDKTEVKIEFGSSCADFVDWIAAGNWSKTEQIRRTLWQDVKFPQIIKQRLGQFAPQDVPKGSLL